MYAVSIMHQTSATESELRSLEHIVLHVLIWTFGERIAFQGTVWS